MPEGLRRGDGPAVMQAPITIDAPVSAPPYLKEDQRYECYPKGMGGGNAAASSILPGTLMFVDTLESSQLMETGIQNTTVIGSFGHKVKPLPGEEEEFCSRFSYLGIAKNTLTNPEDGGASMNGGYARPNSQTIAIQVGGSRQLNYDCGEPVIAGDPLIWGPPDVNRTFEGSNIEEIPTAVIRPLHWTRIAEVHLQKLDWVMLQRQASLGEQDTPLDLGFANSYSDNAKNRWHDAALANKAEKLKNIMAGITVLEKKGHLKINTPERTWEEAINAKFVSEMIAAKSEYDDGAKGKPETELLGEKTNNIMEEYLRSLDEMKEHPFIQESERPNDVFWAYNKVENDIKGYQLGTLNMTDHSIELSAKVKKNSVEETLYDRIGSDDAIAIEIRRLGLGEDGQRDELIVDTTEVLMLCCYSSLDTLSTRSLWVPVEVLSGGIARSEIEKTYRQFEDHLQNTTMRVAAHQLELKQAVENRIVARAMSSSAASVESNYGNSVTPWEQRILDVIINAA